MNNNPLIIHNDLWYKIQSFLNVIELSKMCFVSSYQRSLAFHTFSKIPYLDEFINMLLESFPKQLSDLISSDTSLENSIFILLPRISTLVSRISKAQLDANIFLYSITDSILYDLNYQSKSTLMDIACPLTEEIFYHTFKDIQVLHIYRHFLNSLPAMNGYVRALQSQDSKIQHVSIEESLSLDSFFINLLTRFGFNGKKNMGNNENDIALWLRDVFQSGIWYKLFKKGRNKVFECLKKIQQPKEPEEMNHNGNENITDNSSGSFDFGSQESSGFGFRGFSDSNAFGNDNGNTSSFARFSFGFNRPQPTNNTATSITDESSEPCLEGKDLNSTQFEDLVQPISGNLYKCKSENVQFDGYWGKLIFDFSKSFLCNTIQAYNVNQSVRKVSGEFCELMEEFLKTPKEGVSFYAYPNIEGKSLAQQTIIGTSGTSKVT
eukprot:gb/GECH01008694.1/.p1 GENE.gb/GECH01008694.1/~~gb/GECH01008694.1/.p1  ORF type:complete len:435 (+),score=59.20 gb/GECH01008694.1/:1-1305(+)